FAFFAQLFTGLTGSCNGGLLAMTMPDELRGQTAGWFNAGNLSGGGLGAWLALVLLGSDVPPILVGIVYAVMTFAPALAIPAVAPSTSRRGSLRRRARSRCPSRPPTRPRTCGAC